MEIQCNRCGQAFDNLRHTHAVKTGEGSEMIAIIYLQCPNGECRAIYPVWGENQEVRKLQQQIQDQMCVAPIMKYPQGLEQRVKAASRGVLREHARLLPDGPVQWPAETNQCSDNT